MALLPCGIRVTGVPAYPRNFDTAPAVELRVRIGPTPASDESGPSAGRCPVRRSVHRACSLWPASWLPTHGGARPRRRETRQRRRPGRARSRAPRRARDRRARPGPADRLAHYGTTELGYRNPIPPRTNPDQGDRRPPRPHSDEHRSFARYVRASAFVSRAGTPAVPDTAAQALASSGGSAAPETRYRRERRRPEREERKNHS